MRGAIMGGENHRIVLAVTTQQSLILMDGLPEYLAKRGWVVHVVCSGGTSEIGHGVAFHNINMARDPAPWRDICALIRWVALLRNVRPNIIVSGTPKAGLLGMLAGYIARVPARVYMLRGLRLETERGPKLHLLGALERVTAMASTRVIAVSHSLARAFVEAGYAPVEKVRVLGAGSSNGVNPAPDNERGPTRERLGIGSADLVVGYVGRISSDKGVDLLGEAIALMLRDGYRVHTLLVGAEEAPGYLVEETAFGRLPKGSLTQVGWVPDVGPYYRLMDLLCLPTKREGFPNVVLEASVRGVPSVVTQATGTVDAVVDGSTGVIVEDRSASALAAALTSLLVDAKKRQAMGAAAAERALSLFARDRVHAITEAQYRTELERSTG